MFKNDRSKITGGRLRLGRQESGKRLEHQDYEFLHDSNGWARSHYQTKEIFKF